MLAKYYSLDECQNRDSVYDHLEALEEEGKIYFESIDEDIIRIDDCTLTPKEVKDLVKYLDENDVIEYLDYEDESDDFEDEEDDFDPFSEDF
jgi:hypothetical protein